MIEKKLSNRLVALLVYIKKRPEWNGWHSIEEALGEMYSHNMTVRNAVHHAVQAYKEVIEEPRFQIGHIDNLWEELVLAPIYGINSIDFMGPDSMDTNYTVEQFYDSMIMKIMGTLVITRVDWCKDQLIGL